VSFQAAIACDALGQAAVIAVEADERIGTLPEWRVGVRMNAACEDLAAVIGAEAELSLADGVSVRTLALRVVRVVSRGIAERGHHYDVFLSGRAAPLALREGYRIFQEKTAQQIISEVLTDAGVPESEISFRLAGQYVERPYCVQYGETEWAFVERLCAEEGINVWHDQTDDEQPLVVFGDHDQAHASMVDGMTLAFQNDSGMVPGAFAITRLEHAYRVVHDRVHVRDFDVQNPERLIEATAGDGPLEYYEYPGYNPHDDAATARAGVRLEQVQREEIVARGETPCVRVWPGRVVEIEGCADEEQNGQHLVVRARHLLEEAHVGSDRALRYHNQVELVPYGRGRTYRPDLPRRRPTVDGIDTAVVTGPAGEEIHVDDLGCVKLRYRWDRSGVSDDKSSFWARTLQMNIFGSMILPRMEWEVPVLYAHGNPDCPIVVGRLYNGTSPVPYGQPGNRATTTLQSGTSPADGTTHEVRMGDDAGSQEVFVHATKDQSVAVGGNHTVTVGANETLDITKSYALHVKGAQSRDVGSNQTVVVGANCSLKSGGRDESIGGAELINVTGSLNCEVSGGYGEVVGGIYGIQCNQSNTVIQGAFTQTVAGAMATVSGLGFSNSAAAVRLHDVGGVRSCKASSTYADSTKGVKSITAGPVKLDAGTKVVTAVDGAGSTTCTQASMKAGGKLRFEAANITIEAGGGFRASGGSKLDIKGGFKPKGKVKRKASKTKNSAGSKTG
jgi:type VI secretion system secreted protein VgrG